MLGLGLGNYESGFTAQSATHRAEAHGPRKSLLGARPLSINSVNSGVQAPGTKLPALGDIPAGL